MSIPRPPDSYFPLFSSEKDARAMFSGEGIQFVKEDDKAPTATSTAVKGSASPSASLIVLCGTPTSKGETKKDEKSDNKVLPGAESLDIEKEKTSRDSLPIRPRHIHWVDQEAFERKKTTHSAYQVNGMRLKARELEIPKFKPTVKNTLSLRAVQDDKRGNWLEGEEVRVLRRVRGDVGGVRYDADAIERTATDASHSVKGSDEVVEKQICENERKASVGGQEDKLQDILPQHEIENEKSNKDTETNAPSTSTTTSTLPLNSTTAKDIPEFSSEDDDEVVKRRADKLKRRKEWSAKEAERLSAEAEKIRRKKEVKCEKGKEKIRKESGGAEDKDGNGKGKGKGNFWVLRRLKKVLS